jgi:hypothetical protein
MQGERFAIGCLVAKRGIIGCMDAKAGAGMAVETETTITVTFPTDLFDEIKRISAEENWPESKAVILLARLGAKAQKEAEEKLRSSHNAFINENDPQKRDQLGDEMTRSIFGPGAIG